MVLSTRKKKNPRNTIKSKILKTRKKKRDFDQVYKDYFNQPELSYDEDKKGYGQHKCFACDIYFINDDTKKQHEKSKKHKRRVKMLNKETPHTYHERTHMNIQMYTHL
ncbi:zinc finger protein, putative [Plasmodium malariae]|uniref:Zinc finger protein, putative n=1 Tax=Plasmodium malariae TaxID=5858 RepID=A0A1D3SPU3_PLAMA|nr:zinc finger protein, putative [Plasmodium malariae]SCO93928.1 zinc finger protein, putative [Plasmodium malariae]